MLGKKEETRLCSLVFRNLKEVRELNSQSWYLQGHGADRIFKIYAIASTNQKIYVLPEVMSCYRLHTGGVWSMIDIKVQKSRMISDFNLTISNFQYTTEVKRKLLKVYLSKYLLFDIKYFKFKNVVNIISKLSIK